MLLLLGLLFVYNVNLRQVSSFDTYASRFVPLSILRDGDLILDEFFPENPDGHAGDNPDADYVFRSRGRLYDSHPVVGPLLALPVYALPAWTGIPSDQRLTANLFSKVAASLMAAFSALAVFATVRRLLVALRPELSGGTSEGVSAGAWSHAISRRHNRVALLTAVVYGLCTPVWSTASQAMWSHTLAVLGYAVALWALAAAAVARPATTPAAALLILYAAHVAWRSARRWSGPAPVRKGWAPAIRCGAGALLVGGIGVAYNFWLFTNAVGGAPFRTQYWLDQLGASSMFEGSLFTGLAGLTISPSRGLFVFSPILVVAVFGGIKIWRMRPAPRSPSGVPLVREEAVLLGRYASLAALAILLVYAKFVVWWGGHGFGPRYLAEAMPFFGLLLGFALSSPRAFSSSYRSDPTSPAAEQHAQGKGRRPARLMSTTVLALFICSALVQAVGAFCWPSPWTLDKNPPYFQRLWEWRNSQIVVCIRSGPRLDPAARRVFSRLGLVVQEDDPDNADHDPAEPRQP